MLDPWRLATFLDSPSAALPTCPSAGHCATCLNVGPCAQRPLRQVSVLLSRLALSCRNVAAGTSPPGLPTRYLQVRDDISPTPSTAHWLNRSTDPALIG